jgi:hypothetical protein
LIIEAGKTQAVDARQITAFSDCRAGDLCPLALWQPGEAFAQ